MPNDDATTGPSAKTAPKPANNSVFAVPAPIRRLFSHFPLVTYPANTLPIRAPHSRHQHALYIFTTPSGAEAGAPSFNPGCLKWQAYLKISGIEFRTISSSNHASPSGALPFLLPGCATTTASDPITTGRLQKWTVGQGGPVKESQDFRYEAYMALIESRIRKAWLYYLYLTSNFHTVAAPLYILPSTTSSLVRLTLARELRQAAEAELLKTAKVIDAEMLYREAEEAFEALATLLGENKYFFNSEKPGLFDAAVFAYTHLLLDEHLGRGWSNRRLSDAVKSRKSLVRHRNRLLHSYFG